MFVRYLHWLGIAACITLIISCFLPWVYYADIKQTFTGFYSFKNEYGRPGKFLVATGLLILVFMLLPKLWAKRANLFIGAITLAYGVKSYILFSSCYNNYCPEKLYGLYIMLFSTIVMMITVMFPKLDIAENKAVS
ncbi:MAG TPA: hypothetical protein VK489_07410 [Ferruginibacter sp.]|nr:hypothetical protein [Ferruginibacter sp.]